MLRAGKIRANEKRDHSRKQVGINWPSERFLFCGGFVFHGKQLISIWLICLSRSWLESLDWNWKDCWCKTCCQLPSWFLILLEPSQSAKPKAKAMQDILTNIKKIYVDTTNICIHVCALGSNYYLLANTNLRLFSRCASRLTKLFS